MSNLKQVTIYTRGVCTATGTGGYALVLLYGDYRKELSGGFRLTTNNRMDILAAIEGLKALKTRCKVTVYNNNTYLVDAMTKGWAQRWRTKNWKNSANQRTPNVDLWNQLLELSSQHEVEFIWLKRQVGKEEYVLCDALARQAANQQDLPNDEGYHS